MSKELTWAQAIDKVLGTSAVPLHYSEITEKIIADGLRKSLGATPAATVASKISVTRVGTLRINWKLSQRSNFASPTRSCESPSAPPGTLVGRASMLV